MSIKKFHFHQLLAISILMKNLPVAKSSKVMVQHFFPPASWLTFALLSHTTRWKRNEISFPCRINQSSSLFYSTIIIFPCSSNFTGKIHNRVVGHLAVFSSIIPMVTWILAAISFCGLNLTFALQCHVSQSRYRKYEYFSYYIKRKTIEKYSYIAYLCVWWKKIQSFRSVTIGIQSENKSYSQLIYSTFLDTISKLWSLYWRVIVLINFY